MADFNLVLILAGRLKRRHYYSSGSLPRDTPWGLYIFNNWSCLKCEPVLALTTEFEMAVYVQAGCGQSEYQEIVVAAPYRGNNNADDLQSLEEAEKEEVKRIT